MEKDMYVVIVTEGKDDPEVVKFGTKEECEAYLFNIIRPSPFTSNFKQIDCDNGYSFSKEVKDIKSGEWRKMTFHLRSIHN